MSAGQLAIGARRYSGRRWAAMVAGYLIVGCCTWKCAANALAGLRRWTHNAAGRAGAAVTPWARIVLATVVEGLLVLVPRPICTNASIFR